MNDTTPYPASPHPRRLASAAAWSVLMTAAIFWSPPAGAGHVTWLSGDSGALFLAQRDLDSPEAAILDLLAGPTAAEKAQGIVSAIPDGVTLLDLEIIGDGAVIDLSEDAAQDLTESRADAIFRQFLLTMAQFGLDTRVSVLVEGRLLSDYLPPPPAAIYSAPAEPKSDPAAQPKNNRLSGRRITLSPGHGYTYVGTHWTTQRGVVCGNPQEDFRNLELARYLRVFLENDGAYVQEIREHDLSRGNGPSGHPWWQQAAYAYLRDQSYACNVYASLTGTCSYTGANHRDDDIRARPLASNLDSRGNTDIFLSIHTNAFQGECYSGCPSGTGTYYMDQGEHATWGAASRTLAGHITLAVVAAANEAGEKRGDGADWQCHGTCAPKYGNFGEIRIPHRPAALIELGFHDSCNTDAPVMEQPFFQSVTMWGMYKGVCDYFGTTPGWPLYASELVSTTIPAEMVAGESRQVQISYRNKSVLWHRDHGFKLAAEGDADHFASHRHELGSQFIDNNGTHTFTLTFTAPETPGSYQTSWGMIREGHRRFGEQLTRTVVVVPDVEPCHCEPGETEEEPCGDCGVRTRVCGADCYWEPFGPCETQGIGESCETNLLGPCSQGIWTCEDESLECAPLVEPQAEICDGIDNSCNGLIDDGFPTEMGSPPPPYAAELIDVDFPETLFESQSATVDLSFRNVGSEAWPSGQIALFHLAPDEPSELTLEGPWADTGIAALVMGRIAPGETASLSFGVKAPATSGQVSDAFQLLASGGVPMPCPSPVAIIEAVVDGRIVIEPEDDDEDVDGHFYVTGGCGCQAVSGFASPWATLLWSLLLLVLWRRAPAYLKSSDRSP